MASTDPQNERQRDSEHAQDHEIDLPEKPLSMVFSEAAVFQPPNGGLRAWSCVAGALLLQFCSFGFVNACGVFQYYYQETLLSTQSSSSLAWITTLQIFLLFILGPLVGKLVDAYGCRPVIAPFSIMAVFAVCMISLCTKYWQIMLAQGICFGLAASGLCLPGMALATQWFSTKRGLAVGIVASGSSLGGVIYPCVLPILIDNHGFPAAVRWTALLQGILLLIANVLCSTPFKPKGFPKKGSGRKSPGLESFKSWPWIFFIWACFFTMWGLFAPLNYLPEFSADKGISVRLSQYTLAIANAGSIIGRIMPGWLSDRVGQFNVLFGISALSGTLILVYWLPVWFHFSNAAVIIFAVLYGFASGGFVSLGPACVAVLAEGRVEEIGFKLGGFCVAVALGALTGLPIEGAIKDRQGGSFLGMIVFAGLSMFLGGVCAGIARGLRGGWSLNKKV